MHIIPFEPDHLRGMLLQQAQQWMGPMLGHEYGESLKRSGPCFTLEDEGRAIICAGVVEMWEGRGHAWSLIAQDAGAHFVRIVRAMRHFLDLQDTRRIEAAVGANFEQGHRLMKMLGFEREGLMRAYLPNGQDAVLYGRVR